MPRFTLWRILSSTVSCIAEDTVFSRGLGREGECQAHAYFEPFWCSSWPVSAKHDEAGSEYHQLWCLSFEKLLKCCSKNTQNELIPAPFLGTGPLLKQVRVLMLILEERISTVWFKECAKRTNSSIFSFLAFAVSRHCFNYTGTRDKCKRVLSLILVFNRQSKPPHKYKHHLSA